MSDVDLSDYHDTVREAMVEYNAMLGDDERFKDWESTIDMSISPKGNVLTVKIKTKIQLKK